MPHDVKCKGWRGQHWIQHPHAVPGLQAVASLAMPQCQFQEPQPLMDKVKTK